MTRTILLAGAAALGLTAGTAGALAQDTDDGATATANMVNLQGDLVAKVSLIQLAQGTHVVLSGNGLPPGIHAFHIHETGSCDPGTGFKSAGGHYNPGGNKHGWKAEEGHHAGDLPNVHVGENGAVAVEFFTADIAVGEDGSALFDADGSAVVMHQGVDDYATDPAGAAGDRIACGVIKHREG